MSASPPTTPPSQSRRPAFLFDSNASHKAASKYASWKQTYGKAKRGEHGKAVKAFHKATNLVYDREAARNPLFKEVLDSQRAYIKMARKWTEISDYAYLKDNLE